MAFLKKKHKRIIKKNAPLIIIVLMVASSFLPFVYQTKHYEFTITIDFGKGDVYSTKMYVVNISALDAFKMYAGYITLTKDNKSIKCVANLCNNGERWIFYINGKRANLTPSEYFVKDKDWIALKYESKNASPWSWENI